MATEGAPSTATAYTNRLADAISPYLLQHAHNPVDWYPWGGEALEGARQENKPIFLSIGYSACHWCHVMERESFEDDTVAAFLNDHFICIKVDREERPDLDDIYMTATQLMTGSGGWPLSVFLTPDLKPFYAGTYFPPEDMQGRPGFITVLKNVADAWEQKHDGVVQGADEMARAIREQLAAHGHAKRGKAAGFSARVFDRAINDLRAAFDPWEGGFGSAPKFPPSAAIAFLLRQYLRTAGKDLLHMASLTLDKMAAGGIYDHLGGGFHRYSVDARWLVPHFEKMLYDQAQLSAVYLEAYQLTRKPLYRRIVEETLDYVLRDMTDEAGGFCSAEDADSEGREGVYYLWTEPEILSLLGKEDGHVFCAHYSVKLGGNFDSPEEYHAHQNILHAVQTPEQGAIALGVGLDEFERRMKEMRGKLFEARMRRSHPGRDDKVLASWSALVVSAIARAYQVLEEGRYRAAAERAADFILTRMTDNGRLLHTYRSGESRVPGFLDDYAFMVVALIDLYEATFELRWLDAAEDLARQMIDLFWDVTDGGFYFTSAAHTGLIARSKPAYDGAEPSGNAMAALGLLRLARFTDNADFRGKALRILVINAESMNRMPRALLNMLCAADFIAGAAREVAIVGARDSQEVAALLRALHSRYAPTRIVAFLDPFDGEGQAARNRIPLLQSKELVSGKAAVYICKDYVCEAPVTDPEDVAAALNSLSPGRGA